MASRYKIVYSPHYGKVNLGNHVFPVKKYDLVREKLLDNKVVTQDDFVEAPKASDEDILLAHTEEYLNRLKEAQESKGNWLGLMWQLEMPYCKTPKELIEASFYCVGGTILASRLALESGIGIHIGGGFHHAFPDHGEGFCVVNDHSIAICKLQKVGKVGRVAVIDCDLHQGNGTAYIFRSNPSVYTFSIHAQSIYPAKERSDEDIGLGDFTEDQVYLGYLRECVPRIINDFKPDLVVYVAGADPYKNDMLSPLNISIEGLKERDQIVISEPRKKKIPVVIVLAGGYAEDVKDTVEIHCNTIKTALSLFTAP
jgi:acetoin utilization deacetylase AcuC-like enzyme